MTKTLLIIIVLKEGFDLSVGLHLVLLRQDLPGAEALLAGVLRHGVPEGLRHRVHLNN